MATTQTTVTVTTASGRVVTRTSARTYTHAVLGTVQPGVEESVSFRSSEVAAEKEAARWVREAASFGNTEATARVVPVTTA